MINTPLPFTINDEAMNNIKPTVLVVEDEALLLRSIVLKLEKGGLNVATAHSGEEAFDYLERKTPPDFIWLDYYLEGEMSGVDVIHKLSAHPAWSKIPVIVVSNTATEAKIDEMLKSGALKYFLKAEHLLGEIVEFIWSVLNERTSAS